MTYGNKSNLHLTTMFDKPGIPRFGRAVNQWSNRCTVRMPLGKAVGMFHRPRTNDVGHSPRCQHDESPRKGCMVPVQPMAHRCHTRSDSVSSIDLESDVSPFAGESYLLSRSRSQSPPMDESYAYYSEEDKSSRQVTFSRTIEVIEVPAGRHRWSQTTCISLILADNNDLQEEQPIVPEAAFLPGMKVWNIDDSETFLHILEETPIISSSWWKEVASLLRGTSRTKSHHVVKVVSWRSLRTTKVTIV